MSVMDQFQTQSQWENETEDALVRTTGSSKKPHRHGITINKKTILVLSALLIIGLAAGLYYYSAARSIEGIWVRQMDDNTSVAGMTVEVRRNGSRLEGVIISMPAGAESFYVGQVKWFGIHKTGFGKYEYYDLISKDNGSEYDYGSNIDDMVVSADESQLTISSNNDTEKGQHQLWVKQK